MTPTAPAATVRLLGGRCSPVLPGSPDPAPDPEERREHPRRIPKGADARVSGVAPVDGDLPDHQAPAPGAVEHFGVEFEAAADHGPEQFAADVTPEGLEAALGVMQTWQQQSLDEEVEDAAHRLAVDRLVDLDQAPVERPRADRDVSAVLDRADQRLSVGYRRREVGVGEEDDVALRCQDPGADRGALAKVDLVANEADIGALPVHRVNRGDGAIAAPVIDHDDLIGAARCPEVFQDQLK